MEDVWYVHQDLLSLFRLLLIPVYVIIYLRAQKTTDYIIAGVILAISCLTDFVDGKIARKFNMITTLGKFLDPLADKVTQFTLILCLAIRYHVLWSVLTLFVMKEMFQLVAGALAAHHGYILKGALFSGKICTTVLFVSLVTLVVFPTLSDSFVSFFSFSIGKKQSIQYSKPGSLSRKIYLLGHHDFLWI